VLKAAVAGWSRAAARPAKNILQFGIDTKSFWD